MANLFSPKLSKVLAFSREEAARLSSSAVGPEHLLLGLMRDVDNAVDLYLMIKNEPNNVKHDLEQRVRENGPQPANARELSLNEQASNILKLAVLEARLQKADMVDENHLLLAILHDHAENGARMVLEKHHIYYENMLGAIGEYVPNQKNGLNLPDNDEDDPEMSAGGGGDDRNAGRPTVVRKGQKSKTPVLDNFGIDLTRAAASGKLDPVVGREREMERVIEILGRRKKNNPVLIGEPGVGKSAIVEGLAQLIVKRQTSPVLFNKRIINLDMTGIVAGTKYRGQFEERIKALIKELENSPDIIVFIDEIHTMVGAGSTPGSMDAANILKPALARGTIQCIGATTLDEFRNSIEKDGALERRFQKVIVDPTTAQQTMEILHNIKDRYEQHHHVTYTEEALAMCVKLSDRYITDRHFPDKAIDVLDEVGSRVHLKHAVVPPELVELEKEIVQVKEQKIEAVRKQDFELAAGYRDQQVQLEEKMNALQESWNNGEDEERSSVTADDVAGVVSTMSGVPVQRIAEAESEQLKTMADKLKHEVIAQDRAVDQIVKAIRRNRLGLRAPNHPIGAFMFLGPTGVGKTYLAKKLAEHMFGSPDALIRVDMSEYSESFNTSRLVGAPPGYVGYEEGGQLTERVRRKPYSIVLLDEIEKAHGNVFNMLLQVLDEGRLTDGVGRLIDFRNTVIIMTSNAGTRQLKDFGRGIGFTTSAMGIPAGEEDKNRARDIIRKSLSKQFSPEFLNRLDEIITFDPLDLDAIKRIINTELKELLERIESQGYHFEISEEAKAFVAMKGYDVQYGARPLKRAIQNYIEDGVCELMLSDKLQPGNTIRVEKGEKELSFDVV